MILIKIARLLGTRLPPSLYNIIKRRFMLYIARNPAHSNILISTFAKLKPLIRRIENLELKLTELERRGTKNVGRFIR